MVEIYLGCSSDVVDVKLIDRFECVVGIEIMMVEAVSMINGYVYFVDNEDEVLTEFGYSSRRRAHRRRIVL